MPFIFFFQAEDGIRDLYVTGVQTCALPILSRSLLLDHSARGELTESRMDHEVVVEDTPDIVFRAARGPGEIDRKSTRLNSSHVEISYAVFCLKKKREHRAYGSLHYYYSSHI